MGDSSAGDEAIAASVGAHWRIRARVPAGDRDLIRAAQSGSPDALEELARRSWPDAFRVAIVIVRDRAAAEDIAQDSVLAALESLDRFNPRRPFAPWLHRIVTNRSLDWVRKRARRAQLDATLERPPVRVEETRLSNELHSALACLSLEERSALVLRHLVGLRSHEIAKLLDLKAGSVRSMLHRARRRLATELGENGPRRRDG